MVPLDMAPLRYHHSSVEKRTPHYALDSIKATFTTSASLRMTRTAQNTAFALGILLADVVKIIQAMSREQFYKSMTSLADHRIWQDVYQVPFESLILYVKFTTDAQGYLVISFKEK
jgi:motility quorum-sensing regulator / GCU-specific mRNA interferase toxin